MTRHFIWERNTISSNFADDARNTSTVMTPPGDGLGGFFFGHKRSAVVTMVKIVPARIRAMASLYRMEFQRWERED